MSFFESNLTLLQEYDPHLADTLRSYHPGGRAEVFETPTGKLSLRLTMDDKTFLLHSSRDPEREVERWLNTFELNSMYNLMILGCGMMHHAVALVKRFHSNLKHLAVIEHDMDVLHAVFQHTDLSPFLQTKMVFFLASPDKRGIRKFMNDHLTPFVINGLEIVEHPASIAVNPQYYKEIKQEINESLQSGEVILRTKVQLGGMIQENIIRNIPLVLQHPAASALQGIFQNIPAFIVCAGPSLDKNVEQLKAIQDRGLLIAVDTVYKKLMNLGIQPHIVVSTDPTYLNSKHFENIADMGETIFAVSPSIYHKIPRQIESTKLILPLPGSRILKVFGNALGDMNYMATGTNVGQTAFNLARMAGCNPIVLTGLDLSFPLEGGKTHATGTALQRTIKQTETQNKLQVELIADKPEWEEFTPIIVPGNDGRNVATSKFWFGYLRSFEEEIHKTSARVINSTEGGANIEGTEIQPLAQTIQDVCVKDCMINSTLQMSVGFFFGVDQNEGKVVLEEALNILKYAQSKAEEGLSQIEAVKSIAAGKSPDSKLIDEEIDHLHQIHVSLVQNHKIYSVLDEAADRVLHPFIQYENRPATDAITDVNIKKSITRYETYFHGMKELCEQFTAIAQETLEEFDDNADATLTTW